MRRTALAAAPIWRARSPQMSVPCRVALAGTSRRDQELAHHLSLILQRQTHGHALERSIGTRRYELVSLPECDCSVGRFQRTCCRLDDCLERSLRGERSAHSFPDTREDAVRIVPLPIHQPVDAGLEPASERSEEHRDQCRGEQGNRQVSARLHYRLESIDHHQIQPDQTAVSAP